MKICEILKQLRIEHGITQTQLAEKLGIGQTTIASYENGLREPHIYSLIAYANCFNCSLDFLAGRTDDTYTEQNYSTDEIKILRIYHELNPELQTILLNFANTLKNSEINKK